MKDELSWVLEHPYVRAISTNLTSVQARCTELLEENRKLKRLLNGALDQFMPMEDERPGSEGVRVTEDQFPLNQQKG